MVTSLRSLLITGTSSVSIMFFPAESKKAMNRMFVGQPFVELFASVYVYFVVAVPPADFITVQFFMKS